MRRWNYSLSTITALHDGGLVLLEVPDTPPSPQCTSCINDRAVSKGLSVVDARHPTFSPTLRLQHANLAKHVITQCLPLDYASHQVHLEEAMETLGKSSSPRYVPPRFDLLISDPAVGHKFAVANVTQERPQGGGPIRLLLKDRELLEGRAKLVSKIQALLIFDSFLTSEEYVSNDGDVTSRSFDT